MDIINFLFVKIALAQGTPIGSGGASFKNPLEGAGDIPSLIYKLLGGLITIGVPVLVVVIVYAGFLFVSAGGNTENINKAKSTLLWACIGGAILIGAKVIANIVCSTVGTDCSALIK